MAKAKKPSSKKKMVKKTKVKTAKKKVKKTVKPKAKPAKKVMKKTVKKPLKKKVIKKTVKRPVKAKKTVKKPVKKTVKTVKKPMPKPKPVIEKKVEITEFREYSVPEEKISTGREMIGEVENYLDRIGVAIVKLSGTISIGDRIIIQSIDNSREVTQTVQSIHVNRQPALKAEAGMTVGLKVDQPVKKNDVIFRV